MLGNQCYTQFRQRRIGCHGEITAKFQSYEVIYKHKILIKRNIPVAFKRQDQKTAAVTNISCDAAMKGDRAAYNPALLESRTKKD